ncbi:MAG TPA: HAD family acid phosphatase [Sphingomicrobium sp.]
MKRLLAGMCVLLAGCAATPAPSPTPVAAAGSVGPAYQFEFGSGEAGALQMSAFHALIAYAKDKAAHRPENSVVVGQGSPMVNAKFVPCGDKPLAVVFDVDETLILNLGFEARAAAGEPYSQPRWDRWERTGGPDVIAMPGAEHAIDELKGLKITPIFISNRNAASASATEAMLNALQLGPAKHGENLFLQGDDASGGKKDGRRWRVAERYCVVAMVGDQLGDFSDRFNDPMPVAQRRQLAIHSSAGGLWGKGWFVLPNPVYGTALKGGLDDIFPADKRWADPQEQK